VEAKSPRPIRIWKQDTLEEKVVIAMASCLPEGDFPQVFSSLARTIAQPPDHGRDCLGGGLHRDHRGHGRRVQAGSATLRQIGENIVIVFNGKTEKQAGGQRAGRACAPDLRRRPGTSARSASS